MKRIILVLMIFMATACTRSEPSIFYNLIPIKVKDINLKMRKEAVIGLDMVIVPSYIERPQIVTKKGEVELIISEFNRWAEPLANSIQRVVMEDISFYLDGLNIRAVTLVNRKSIDYSIIITINKFDGKFGDKAILDAWVSIVNKDGDIIINDQVKFDKKIGEDYSGLVKVQSELIGDLSLFIARKISKL